MNCIIHLMMYVFVLNGPFPPSFSLFSSFQYTVDSKKMFNIIFLPMTGFEPWTFGIGSDHSTNWATQPLPNSIKILAAYYYIDDKNMSSK